VMDKIEEEVAELREALAGGTDAADGANASRAERAEEEMGDLLFAIANLSRKLGIEPEAALRRANQKFARRFTAMETRITNSGRSMNTMSLDEMEAEWQQVK
jgi:ATP diphosphatase